MTLWCLLSYVPGLPPHRTYRGCVEFVADARAFLERQYGEGFPDAPPLPRDPVSCRFYVETMVAVLSAAEAAERDLPLEEALAIFTEHAPIVEAR